MEQHNKMRERLGKIFGYSGFRIAVMLLVLLRSSSLLNGIIGPFVKVTLLWSVALLVKDLFTVRSVLFNRYRVVIYLFLISYGVTVLVNRDQGLFYGIATFGYLATNLLVIYAYNPKKAPGTVKRELLTFNHFFLVTTFIGQLISLVTFILNINFEFTVNGDTYWFGIHEERLWGFFSNPNTAGLITVISVMLTVVCYTIYQGNVPKGRKWFYGINLLVQLLVFFLCNSRGGLLVLSLYLILLPIVFGVSKYRQLDTKELKRKLTVKIVAVAIAAPLALNGAYVYAIELLPYCVIQNEYISEQLAEAFGEETSGSQVNIKREEFGSAFGGRGLLWQAGTHIIKNNPWFGVGSDNVMQEAYRYAYRYETSYANEPYLPGITGGLHNIFYQVAASSGLVGLVFFVILGTLLFIRALRYYLFSVKEGKFNPIFTSSFLVAVILVAHTMVDASATLYELHYPSVALWTYIGVLMYYSDTEFTKGGKPFLLSLFERIQKGDGSLPVLSLPGKKRKAERK